MGLANALAAQNGSSQSINQGPGTQSALGGSASAGYSVSGNVQASAGWALLLLAAAAAFVWWMRG